MSDGSAGEWRPVATPRRLQARARLLAGVRDYFHGAGVMEVETPACSVAAVTDPAIDSLATRYSGPGAANGRTLYLHTSPEFPMKRLLAAGSGAIFQICRVFRDGESGRFHNPEFTLLEWYRPGCDHHRLMDDVAALVQALLPAPAVEERISYTALFHRHLGIDPFVLPPQALRLVAGNQGVPGVDSLDLPDRDSWLDLLMTHCIEPALPPGLCFIYDYPASQASLARIRSGDPPVSERFELYLDGLELANGFHELRDAAEQRRRFQHDLVRRRELGKPLPPLDERFLSALEAGLLDCAGVALGIDRLLMRVTGASHIDQVLAFPLERA